MKDFFYYLKKGELRIPTCNVCHRKIWPPTYFCNTCYRCDIEMIKVDPKGKVLEYAKSYHNKLNVENMFALIEIGGIRLIGSIIGSSVSVNNSVLLERCGFKNNVYPFYEFRIVDNGDQS